MAATHLHDASSSSSSDGEGGNDEAKRHRRQARRTARGGAPREKKAKSRQHKRSNAGKPNIDHMRIIGAGAAHGAKVAFKFGRKHKLF